MLNTEQFRQRLAGLIDPADELAPEQIQSQRDIAVLFVAALPQVFGENLDRMTLWDRIGTAIQTAYAKTAADDCDFFISRALEHVQAAPADVARNENIARVMAWAADATPEERQAWLGYMTTHLYSVLVRARQIWEAYKIESKGGGSNG